MVGYAERAGFTDIVHKKYTVPYGPWPRDRRMKEIGTYVGLYMDLSLDGFALYPIGQILRWSFEEVQVLVATMRNAIRDPKLRTVSDV